MGSVFSAVGDIVGDVIDFAVDDILKPVFDVVGDVVGGMLDDPLGTILTVAGFIPGPHQPFVIVAKTALALSRGDLIGAALSVAGHYISPHVNTWISDTVGVTTIIDLGVGGGEIIELAAPTFTETVIIGAAKGLVMPAISSLARGGDLEDITKAAFIGGLGSGATAALSYDFEGGVDYFDAAEDEGYPAEVTGAKELEAGYEEYKTIVDSIGDGISDLAKGFKDLPPVVQEIIKNTTASVVTAAISGGDVDLADILPTALATAATKVYFTEGIIKDAYTENGSISPKNIDKLALLNRALDAAITSGFAGTNPVAAFTDVVLQDQLIESSKSIIEYLMIYQPYLMIEKLRTKLFWKNNTVL